MKTYPFLVLALLATAATAADPPKNLFEGGAFEAWDEASGLPTATAWRWSPPKEPFAAMERSTAEAHAGAGSLHLKDDSTARENQTLGYVVAKGELAKLRGKRVEVMAWVKQVAASGPKVVGIGLWGRTEDGKRITASDWTGTTLPTEWRLLRATAVVPDDAALLLVQLHCAGGWGETGEAFFDDVALRVLPEPDAAAAGAAAAPATPEGAFRASFEDQPAVVSDPWPRPTIERGCFWEDGRPVFLLGPWIYPRTHVDWKEGNPDPQGIGHRAYVEAPGRAIFESMGFNASQLSSAWALPGQALYGLGLPDDWRKAEERIGAFFPRFEGQPMVVDFAFGFADALRKADPARARELEQQNGGWHQFLPFCPESPDGLRYYECYLKGGARSALRGGANVLVWELFNEPVYKCQCPGNAARFAERMKVRYGTIARANATWGTVFEDFADRPSSGSFAGSGPTTWRSCPSATRRCWQRARASSGRSTRVRTSTSPSKAARSRSPTPAEPGWTTVSPRANWTSSPTRAASASATTRRRRTSPKPRPPRSRRRSSTSSTWTSTAPSRAARSRS